MQATESNDLQFAPAHYNTGVNTREITDIISFGPYASTWSLMMVMKGADVAYSINKYKDNVVADQFLFGTSNDIVATFDDDVTLSKKNKMKNLKM